MPIPAQPDPIGRWSHLNDWTTVDDWIGPTRRIRWIPTVRATKLHRIDGDTIGLQYHDTRRLVVWTRAGAVSIQTNGHRTQTTRTRLQTHLPDGWTVSVHRRLWWLHTPAGGTLCLDDTEDTDITQHTDDDTDRRPTADARHRARRLLSQEWPTLHFGTDSTPAALVVQWTGGPTAAQVRELLDPLGPALHLFRT